jgi:hypothetical protein
MRSLVIVAAVGAIASMFAPTYSQTPSASPSPSASPPPAVAEQGAPAAGASKRADCQTSTQSLKGQDKRDQMQLCMAQARLDCLKEAIDKKVTGPQRRDFVKSCVGGGEEPM